MEEFQKPRQQPKENQGFDLNSVTEFSGWGDLSSGMGTTDNSKTHSSSGQRSDMGKRDVQKAKQQPQENQGFDLNSVVEFSGWEDISSGKGASEGLKTHFNNDRRKDFNKKETQNAKQQPNENQGFDLSTVTEFSGWGDISSGTGSSKDSKTRFTNDQRKDFGKKEVQKHKRQPQENQGFDLNSVTEFSGWGDISSATDTPKDFNSRSNDRRKNFGKREVQKPRQQPQENQGFDLNSVSEFSGWGDISSGMGGNEESRTRFSNNQRRGVGRREGNRRESFSGGFKRDTPQGRADDKKRQRNIRENPSAGFRRDAPQGQTDDKKQRQNRRESSSEFKRDAPQGFVSDKNRPWQNQENETHGQKELNAWTDISKYNNDHGSARFAEENKRLAEQYGSCITGKNIGSQPGKVGYSFQETNLWEKNKGTNDNVGLIQGPGPILNAPPSQDGVLPGPPFGCTQPPPPFSLLRGDHPGYERRSDTQNKDFNQISPSLRSGLDKGYTRRESPASERKPFADQQYERRSELDHQPQDSFSRYGRRSPPPSAPSVSVPPEQKTALPAPPAPISQETSSDGSTGTLIQKLAECAVKSEEDARLAIDVVASLLKSVKDFHQMKGSANSVVLIEEAEIKFNILKALKNSTQQGGASSELSRTQSQPGQAQSSLSSILQSNPAEIHTPQNYSQMVLNQILGSNTKAPESQAQPDQGEADMEISSGSEDNDTNDQESQKTQPNQKTSRNASQLRSMQAHQLQEWAALQKANDEMDIPGSGQVCPVSSQSSGQMPPVSLQDSGPVHPGSLQSSGPVNQDSLVQGAGPVSRDSLVQGAGPVNRDSLRDSGPMHPGSLLGPAPIQTGSLQDSGPMHPGSLQGSGPMHPGSLLGPAPIQTGSLQDSGPMQPGSLQGSGPMHPGSLLGPAPIQPGSLQDSGPMHPGSLQGSGPMHPGSLQGSGPMHPGSLQGPGQMHPVSLQGSGQMPPVSMQGSGQVHPLSMQGPGQMHPLSLQGSRQMRPVSMQGSGERHPVSLPGPGHMHPMFLQGSRPGRPMHYNAPPLRFRP